MDDKMTEVLNIIYDLKNKMSDKQWIDIHSNISELYLSKTIVVFENGKVWQNSKVQEELYNNTNQDLEEWEKEDLNLEEDETLL
tara:strand:- start:361 stop:612 length:252 start_codon:yes stop_codon:yes gene_type:complete